MPASAKSKSSRPATHVLPLPKFMRHARYSRLAMIILVVGLSAAGIFLIYSALAAAGLLGQH